MFTWSSYTKRQLIILSIVIYSYFSIACGVSIIGPFYPAEAAKKGVTPTQYGLVIGLYDLFLFLFSIINGKYLSVLNIKLITSTGLFVAGSCYTLFGLLTKIQDPLTFLTISHAIRVIQAIGSSCYMTSFCSIIAQEFPDNIGSAYSILESFFGIGLALGPFFGGILFEVGGFSLPFFINGATLLIASIFMLSLLPSQQNSLNSHIKTQSVFHFLKKPAFLLGFVDIVATAYSIGFLTTSLEPHIRSLNLTPFILGAIFSIPGITLTIFTIVFGQMCDKFLSHYVIIFLGSLLIIISFLYIGPAPFFLFQKSLIIVIGSLTLHGIGVAAKLVATFVGFHKKARLLNFPDDMSTYGMISGLFNSSFSLGVFIGQSAAGYLFTQLGFPWASQIVVGLHILLFLVLFIHYLLRSRSFTSLETERQPLIGTK